MVLSKMYCNNLGRAHVAPMLASSADPGWTSEDVVDFQCEARPAPMVCGPSSVSPRMVKTSTSKKKKRRKRPPRFSFPEQSPRIPTGDACRSCLVSDFEGDPPSTFLGPRIPPAEPASEA